MGEELALLRQRYAAEEAAFDEREARTHHSPTSDWDGDVYVGGRWNTLSVLYLIFFLTPVAG